jgi:hypothetical protein
VSGYKHQLKRRVCYLPHQVEARAIIHLYIQQQYIWQKPVYGQQAGLYPISFLYYAYLRAKSL